MHAEQERRDRQKKRAQKEREKRKQGTSKSCSGSAGFLLATSLIT